MQIISGKFRGRKLARPADARPTQNRARVALFNMVMPMVSWDTPRTVWDAFAGSGAFGIEILSRIPNAHVIFTDTSANSIATIRQNVNAVECGARCDILQTDAIAATNKYANCADVIFVDPPYCDANIGAAFVRRVSQMARPNTILIWEQDSSQFIAPTNDLWEIIRDKQYGRARFLIMKRK